MLRLRLSLRLRLKPMPGLNKVGERDGTGQEIEIRK